MTVNCKRPVPMPSTSTLQPLNFTLEINETYPRFRVFNSSTINPTTTTNNNNNNNNNNTIRKPMLTVWAILGVCLTASCCGMLCVGRYRRHRRCANPDPNNVTVSIHRASPEPLLTIRSPYARRPIKARNGHEE